MPAKSRLRTSFSPPPPTVSHAKNVSLAERYRKYLPTLVLSLPWWFLTILLLTKVPPVMIRDWPLPLSYGPLLLVVGNSIFWSSSFLLLSGRRGLFVSIICVLYLLANLQHISNSWWILVGLGALFAIIEVSIRFYRKKTHHYARLSPKITKQT